MKIQKLCTLTAIIIALSTVVSHAATVEYKSEESKVYVNGNAEQLSQVQMKATAPDDSVFYSDFVKDAEGSYNFTIPVFSDDAQGVYEFRISTTNSDGASSEVTRVSIPGIEGDEYILDCFKVSGTVKNKDLVSECTFSKIKAEDKPMLFVAVYKTVTSIKDGTVKENRLVGVNVNNVNENGTRYTATLPAFEIEASTGNIDDQITYCAKVFLWTSNGITPLAYTYEINE